MHQLTFACNSALSLHLMLNSAGWIFVYYCHSKNVSYIHSSFKRRIHLLEQNCLIFMAYQWHTILPSTGRRSKTFRRGQMIYLLQHTLKQVSLCKKYNSYKSEQQWDRRLIIVFSVFLFRNNLGLIYSWPAVFWSNILRSWGIRSNLSEGAFLGDHLSIYGFRLVQDSGVLYALSQCGLIEKKKPFSWLGIILLHFTLLHRHWPGRETQNLSTTH